MMRFFTGMDVVDPGLVRVEGVRRVNIGQG
jgi:hypothetical protein